MKVGVLAVQGAFALHARRIEGLGAVAVEVRTAAALAEVDALVLPGGESTAISMLLERSGLVAPLRERLAAGMPALGTCAGMILLAGEVVDGRPDQISLGAIDVAVRRNAFGRQVDSFEADLPVRGLGGGDDDPAVVRAVFIRAPVVERVGPGVEVLAEVDGRAVACRQGAVMVTAFHPELTADDRLHRAFLRSAGWEAAR